MKHAHTYYALPDDLAADIPPDIDHRLVTTVLSAARDGCTSCVDAATVRLIDNADSVVFLVKGALGMLKEPDGEVPDELRDHRSTHVSTPEFRQLVGLLTDDTISAKAALKRCRMMTFEERTAAINGALSMFTEAYTP